MLSVLFATETYYTIKENFKTFSCRGKKKKKSELQGLVATAVSFIHSQQQITVSVCTIAFYVHV